MSPRRKHGPAKIPGHWRIRPAPPSPVSPRAADLRSGIKQGLTLATGFSVLVLGLVLLRGSADFPRLGVTAWQVIAFYFGAGVIGGAVFGLLRPLRKRYLGRYLSAYLVLLLVYGGMTAVFYESLSRRHSEPVPLRVLLIAWAALCLLLAPLYVYGFRDEAD